MSGAAGALPCCPRPPDWQAPADRRVRSRGGTASAVVRAGDSLERGRRQPAGSGGASRRDLHSYGRSSPMRAAGWMSSLGRTSGSHSSKSTPFSLQVAARPARMAIGTTPSLPTKSQFRRPRKSRRMTFSQGQFSMSRRWSARCWRSSASRSDEWSAALAIDDGGAAIKISIGTASKHYFKKELRLTGSADSSASATASKHYFKKELRPQRQGDPHMPRLRLKALL